MTARATSLASPRTASTTCPDVQVRAGRRWRRGMTTTPQPSVPAGSELLIESGETIAMEAVNEATHSGPLAAVGTRGEIPATGKPYVLPFVGMYTVRDGLIVSGRAYLDRLESLDQLGQTPT